jgi:chromosome segregation ATPase
MAKPSVPAPEPAASALPVVRLEVRTGGSRPTLYEVGDGGFLVGNVPGCDLRLPGAGSPSVLCLIARHAAGASLRKLAPVQPVAVNGRAVSSGYLNSGDRITLGTAEIVVQITGAEKAREGRGVKGGQTAEEIETERNIWEARRAEIEAECRRQAQAIEEAVVTLRRQQQEVAEARAELDAREQEWRDRQEELERLRAQLASSGEQTTKQAEEVLAWRKELAELKHRLHDRFQEKREKLTKMRQGLRKAAVRILQKKRDADTESVRVAAVRHEQTRLQTELEAAREQFERERRILEDQHRTIVGRQQEVRRETDRRLADAAEREQKLIEEKADLERGQKQYQADLVRLDRVQGVVDHRLKQMRERALEVDRGSEQLQRDTRELEEQAAQLDEWRERLTREIEAFEARRQEYEASATKTEQRAAALESQQAMLAALRTRMERMRDELRQQEQAVSEQRVRQEAAEDDLRRRTEEARQLQLDLTSEKELFEQERRRFDERRATLEQAVSQLRQSQETHETADAELRQRRQEVDATAAQQAEQAGILLARGQQLDELHARVAADRQALRDRDAVLSRAEATVAALQEQLRRRGDELAERERSLAELDRRVREETARNEASLRDWERQKKLDGDGLDVQRTELSSRAAGLDELARDLARREEAATAERGRLDVEFTALQGQRHAVQSERVAFEVEKQQAADAAARRQAEFDAVRAEADEVSRQLPELEARGEAALERLLRGREQLREHLAELHAFTRQGRDDLEAARRQLRDEAEGIRQKELELHAARDEHRLAVAAFRQQLVEWQGHLTEMRQSLVRGESRLDRRQAEVEERAQHVAAEREELAHQAEQLQEAVRQVEHKHGEVTRHLGDMREWYRKKMRELAGIDSAANDADDEPDVVPMPVAAQSFPLRGEGGERGILALTGDADPADRQLGGLLRSLELIDADTLAALLLEARRQRRSLRQLLLAGNYLTLYQMALIEAGNLDGLVLGPVRVIDRLKATPREAVYRVFDPRRNHEALLRHLSEAEAQDAVRPDEFRQRFAAAAVLRHDHLAATYEVLDIAGRPAVLQEWLNGLPGTDWPTLAAAPGVWYRLLSQAALALQTVHAAGIVHGQLQPASFVLTGDGVLKLTGLGEPRWLAGNPTADEDEPSVAADLAALGQVAAGWAASTPNRKGAKSKPLPDALQEIVRRLSSVVPGERFDSAAALLEALDRAGDRVPANAAAWERFLKQVREQSEDVALRRTA